MISLHRLDPARRRRGQRGVAAIELALLLPILIIALAPMILCARYMWHYTVAHKAAQDAARYMSTVSQAELMSMTLGVQARSVAMEIVRREMAELQPGRNIIQTEVQCDSAQCGVKEAVPRTVRVLILFNLLDPIFGAWLGKSGIPFEVSVVMPYAGR